MCPVKINEGGEVEPPLVSFILVAYNQERFVDQALDGAFEQDYSNLEIICSDDASTDATYEIMRTRCASYKGAHALKCVRQPVNSGLAAHINSAMNLATGDLIVIAAGDDISAARRCSVLAKRWVECDRPIASLYSSYEAIDPLGRTLGVEARPLPHSMEGALSDLNIGVTGATHAWDRRIFDLFGPLNRSIVYEDRALQFRSMMAGRVIFVDEPLVKYRVADNSLSHRSSDSWRTSMKIASENHARRATVYLSFLQDLETAESLDLIDGQQARALRQAGEHFAVLARLRSEFLRGSRRTRIQMIFTRLQVGWKQRVKWLVLSAAPWIFDWAGRRRR